MPSDLTTRVGTVTLHYWAAARAATGVDVEQRTAGRVGDILDDACRDHPDLVDVLRVASVLRDGRHARSDDVVPEGATLEVLPPFAGG